MTLLEVIFVIAVALTIGLGVLGHRRSWSLAGGPAAWGATAAERFGVIPGTLLVGVVGYAVSLGVSLGLGFLAKALQSPIDEPIYNWVFPRVQDSFFTKAQNKLTMMGSNPNTQLVCLIAVVALMFAYKRRWYIPLLGVAVAYEGTHYMQNFLARVVDRGHPGLAYPPPGTSGNVLTLGTFPSGGVARILAVYGAILILVMLLQPRLSRAWRAGLWTGLTLMAVVESFSRIYLSKHWTTDAVGGLAFGALLLVTHIAALSAFAWVRPQAEPLATGEPASETVGAHHRSVAVQD